MNRIRAFTFPRGSSRKHDDINDNNMGAQDASTITLSKHSRDSSGGSGNSSTSSPITPSSPNRSHTRWPSSTSSLATSPDSAVNLTKSSLHDLVEDPAERDDGLDDLPAVTTEEPFCICDTPFCEHRKPSKVHSALIEPSTPEWSPGDDSFSDGELAREPSFKRRRSGEYSTESLTARLSRRLPSMSKRWKDPRPTTAVSSPVVHSAPPSRSSSLRLRPLRQSLAMYTEAKDLPTPPFTPVDSLSEDRTFSRSRASTLSRPSKPLDIRIPEVAEDPIDRHDFASTPLLPPMMAEHVNGSTEVLRSPLQSPTVAEPTRTSAIGTPTFSPSTGGMPTPPLSSKASTASFHPGRSHHALHPSGDIPPMSISEETDPWANRLGHANFHITPEPYMPETITLQSCTRLLQDWENARLEYMKQAARINEHYGPTSQTYKLTAEKWAQIDDQWRRYHERAIAEAEANGEITHFQTLAETQPVSRLPSLNDPDLPAKFPKIEAADVVGPMVQYAKVQRQVSKRQNFLRIFTDPASLLGRRPTISIRR